MVSVPEELPTGGMSALRRQAERASEMEPELQQLRQENALLRAGLGQLTETQHRALLGAHEGREMTAEALGATWDELNLPFTVEPQVPLAERAAHQRVSAATAGADASEAHVTTVNDELTAARSSEEVMAILHREGAVGTD